MTKLILTIISIGLLIWGVSTQVVEAQTLATPTVEDTLTATDSATASATASAEVAENVEPTPSPRPNDITQTPPQQLSPLAMYLRDNPLPEKTWYNFMQQAIREAVLEKRLPANIVVLILLFPAITAIISASRHLVGLRGFGVYIPAVLAVAFVSTGIVSGIAMFLVVLVSALGARRILKFLELQSLPRTAMLFWIVSIVVLTVLVLAAQFNLQPFLSVSIFPLLIMMLLAENFIETQLTSSQSQAIELTLETLLIAVVCSFVISSPTIQRFVILNPELTLLSVAAINIIGGKYAGLRLLEYIRFRSLLKD